MRIDHRRLHITMPQQFLDSSDIVAVFEQMRREAMAQRVAACRLGDVRRAHCGLDASLNRRLAQVMAADRAAARVSREAV